MYEIILFYSNSEKMKLRKSQVGSLLQCQFLKKLLKVKKKQDYGKHSDGSFTYKFMAQYLNFKQY